MPITAMFRGTFNKDKAGGALLRAFMRWMAELTVNIISRPSAVAGFLVLAGLSVCCGCDGTTETAPQPKSIELFVANELNGSILVLDASGSLLRTIVVPELSDDIVADSVNKELFVVENVRSSISVYPTNAVGNPQPLRTLTGYLPGYVGAIAVDIAHNEMVVMSAQSRWGFLNIDFFERTASGDATPLRRIIPDFPFARALLVDSMNDEIFVAVPTVSATPITPATTCSISVFSRTVEGRAAPIRTLSGSATGLKEPIAMVLDTTENELIVADAENDSVLVYPRNANGNISPLRIISGNSTGLSGPSGIVLDAGSDMIYVSNYSNDSVTVYPRKANGNFSPVMTFTRPQIDIRGPTSISLAFK